MSGIQLDDVIRIAGDDLYMRHLLFLRYILGEPLRIAVPMARLAVDNGLTITRRQMIHVARNWPGGAS